MLLLKDDEITIIETSCTYPDYTGKTNGFRVDWEEFSHKVAEAQLKKDFEVSSPHK